MFAEDSSDANGLKWRVSHHYESQVKGSMIVIPARARRLAQEAVTLSTSLPLSYNSTVFVRCDEDRLDLMKVIHTGSGILCEFAEFCVSIMRKFQVHILIDLFLSFPQNFDEQKFFGTHQFLLSPLFILIRHLSYSGTCYMSPKPFNPITKH